MKLKNKMKKARKEISDKEDLLYDSDNNALITVKAMEEAQIFSSYDFDCNEKLNEELAEYLWDKARFVPVKDDIRIKMYVGEKVNIKEVQNAIHNKFRKEYVETKLEKKHNCLFSFAMFVVGLLALAVLVLSYAYFKNEYVDLIVEIVAWVFMWEAVDAFFLERSKLNRKQMTLLKLCVCDIEIVKAKNQKSTKMQQKI